MLVLAKISHLQLSSKLKRLTKKRRLEKENDDDEVEAAEEINIRAGKSGAKRSITKGSMNMNTLKILELSNKLTLGMAKRKTSIRDNVVLKS